MFKRAFLVSLVFALVGCETVPTANSDSGAAAIASAAWFSILTPDRPLPLKFLRAKGEGGRRLSSGRRGGGSGGDASLLFDSHDDALLWHGRLYSVFVARNKLVVRVALVACLAHTLLGLSALADAEKVRHSGGEKDRHGESSG